MWFSDLGWLKVDGCMENLGRYELTSALRRLKKNGGAEGDYVRIT